MLNCKEPKAGRDGIKESSLVSIQALGQELQVSASEDALTCKSPVLLVRPESIKIRRAPAGDQRTSGTQGRVVNVVFYGQHVEYSIESEVGNIIALVSDPVQDEIVPVGDFADFSFDASRAWLLPSET